MSISGYGLRYLRHKDFLRLCKELEISSFLSSSDENWLELLEKEKILFPVCRTIFPKSYIKLIYNVYNNPSNPFYGKREFDLPSKFSTVYKLENNIQHYSFNKHLFHIFDKNKYKFKKYIRNPKRTKFLQWKDYKKYIGKFYGYDKYESVATHYYSYWQAYHFYEITKACTREYVINVFDEEIRSELWHKRIPIKKIFLRTFPLNYDIIRGDFWGQTNNFETLSFYVQTLKKYDHLISLSKHYIKDRYGYLDKKSSSYYIRNRRRLTKLIITKYNLSITYSFDFLKFLCEKFEEYNKQKKDKLAQFIKQDIHFLIQLMHDGFNLEYENINKKLGRVISNPRNTLDVIFPPLFAKEKENVLYTLDSILSDNLSYYRFENVSRDEIKEFLSFMDLNNLQLFYHSLGQINFANYIDQSIYLHLFYLSLLLENFIKVIGRKSAKKDLEFFFSNYKEMKKSLVKLFDSEGWRHSLSSHWAKHTTIDSSFNIKEKILNDISKGCFHQKKEWNKIIKMFLTCGIARNLSAHEQSIVYNLDRETYLILMNNIVSAIWFTWKFAVKEGYINDFKKD